MANLTIGRPRGVCNGVSSLMATLARHRAGLAADDDAAAAMLVPLEYVLAFATMAATPSAPLLREEIAATTLLPAWDRVRHPPVYAAMSGSAGGAVRPLEPDIVGEFFVLEALAALEADAAELVEAAWQARPENMWWFVSRCATDFPDHAQFRRTYAIQPQTMRIAEEWGKAAFNLVSDLGPREAERQTVLDLYGEVRALAARDDATPDIRLQQAMAAFNLMHHLGAREAERQTVLDLYGEVRGLADAHPEEEALLSLADRTKSVLSLLHSEDDLPSLLQALHLVSQAITQPNANPLARSAYATALAGVLMKAAEEGVLASVTPDLVPPSPEIALAAQVLILRDAGEDAAAEAALVDMGRGWPQETVDQVRVLIDGVAKIKALQGGGA